MFFGKCVFELINIIEKERAWGKSFKPKNTGNVNGVCGT